MQNRERGAAHINIYYFLVLMVLFLGALWFGYVVLTQNNEMDRARADALRKEAQARANLNQYVEYVREISDILGETGEYTSSKNLSLEVKQPDGSIQAINPLPIPKATLPANLRQRITTFSQRLTIPGAVSTPISKLFSEVVNLTDSLKQAKKDADIRADTANTNHTNATSTFNQNMGTANASLAAANTRFSNQMAIANQENQRQVSRNTQQNAQIRQLGDEMNTMRNTHAAAVTKLEKDKNLLQLTNEHLISLTRLINPPDAPDGAIISASTVANVAFIDIGRKDMLPLGTVFKITAPSVDGKSDGKIKAYGTVTEAQGVRRRRPL